MKQLFLYMSKLVKKAQLNYIKHAQDYLWFLCHAIDSKSTPIPPPPPSLPFRIIFRDRQSNIIIVFRISFMVHPVPNSWRGDCNYGAWWSLWGNLGVTIIHRYTADSNTRPVNTVWWIACACWCACRLCVCVCVCPSRTSMAGWCIRWHVNYSAFKRGLSWIEVSGGLMTVWWSERLPLGMRGTCGYLYAYPSITQTCNLSHKWGIRLDSSSNDRYEMSLVLPAGNNILWFGTRNIS